jgi:hypothetical protein
MGAAGPLAEVVAERIVPFSVSHPVASRGKFGLQSKAKLLAFGTDFCRLRIVI